ncbi:MAG: BamA/TamA family outer membrane protein [Chitinophagaceae bacterium]
MIKAFVNGIFLLIFLVCSHCLAQDTLQSRIILIGDAGELTNGRHPVVSGVRSTIPLDKKTTIIFLGDNLYKAGLPDDAVPNYNLVKAPLDSQIVIAKGTDAKVYFIPGNHDWNNGGPHGWEAIQREQYYIEVLGDKNVDFYPKDGCPGPVEVNITDDITLIIMDSQWWIHPYDKPGIESDCPYKTKAEVLTRLDDLLSRNSKKLVLFATHHTFRSYGIHGGYFKIKQYVFPLTDAFPKLYIPIPFGFVYPITRGIFGTAEDMKHPAYVDLVTEVEKVIKKHDNVIYVAGHEHTLQLIKDSGYYYIVSGSGTKSNRVSKSRKSLFATDKNGFATLEISKNKNVKATFYTVDTSGVKKEPPFNLFNFTGLPPKPEDTLREVEVAFKDSVIISASDKYKHATGFKKTFLGNNYRKEWSVPLAFKVFNLRKEKGGLKIESLGGGKQTKTLRLSDKNGKEWTLRSVDKDPEQTIPAGLRGSLAEDVVRDLISASHPYAPLITPSLAKATGVIEAIPQYFFVPDDPAFGIYRKMFANIVCTLEESDPTIDATETKSTAKIINKLVDDHDNHVDQQAYLRARLLDNVIGDWDRHFDQWKWGTTDTGKGKLYYPVPRDRDKAFFNSDGLLLGYLSKNQFKYLQGFGFKKNYYDIKWLNWEARDIDRIFLNLLTENDWKKVIDTFQQKLTNNVIDLSVKKLPPQVYAMGAANISEKLKKRRDVLMKKGIRFYNYLSRAVNITGSNQQEYFKVQNGDDGVQVIVYKKKGNKDSTGIIYNRTFNPKITKELRLYGLNGNDKFEIDENVNTKMKIRMIGGKGNDSFNVKGNARNYVYDITSSDTSLKLEKNFVTNAHKTKVVFSSNPLVNEYKPYGFSYNVYRFPQVNLGYNPEDKLLVGFGFSAKTFGFRKDPYSTFQKLSTLYALNHNAYQVKYQGIFNSVFLNKDILFNAEFVNPTLNNFFGFGNASVRDKLKPIEFYRVRYKYVQADLLLRKRFNSVLEASIGPSYYHYWNKFDDNKNRILGDSPDSASIFGKKDYFGGKLKIDINYVNNEVLPTRGITWYTQLSSLYGLNKNSKNVTRLTSDMTVHGSLSEERKLVGIIRLGAGHIFSKNFEYFQALTLGANNFVRGFRKDRFSGSSLVYGSAEVRVKLFQSNSYFLPGDVGVIGFYDIGKVWMRNEKSKRWHQSYGGGFYYSPFNILIVSATVGISKEDGLFNFSLGTKFRITF